MVDAASRSLPEWLSLLLDLPSFRYHPDPVSTGSVVASDGKCDVCGASRGALYRGPIYGRFTDRPVVCPWCIAEGSAAAGYDLKFTDVSQIPADVPSDAVQTIVRRTPGYSAWQQEEWLYHCADGCEYLGDVGGQELVAFGRNARAAAIDTIRRETWPKTPPDLDELVDELTRGGDIGVYLFRCLHCHEFQVRWDMS